MCSSCHQGPCRCGRRRLLVLIIVFVVAALAWRMFSKPADAPQSPVNTDESQSLNLPEGDSVVEVNQILDSVDTGNLDAEFQAIDADLNNL